MKRRILVLAAVVGLSVLALRMLHPGGSVAAQTNSSRPPLLTYNPYPPGILPSNLDSEIARVLGEIDVVEARAIARWQALPPPDLTNQPPILKDSGTEMIETLGELMQYDKNISPGQNIACASCHMPYAAFSGPIPSVNLTMIAYPGTVHYRAGKRTAQRYTYAPNFPVLQYNETQAAFFGGNFWDSRATGYIVRSPDAEQAQGPPVDTQEMGFPDTACIVFRLSQSVYRPLFEQVFGADSFAINFPPDTEQICSTPGGASAFGNDTMPVKLSPSDRTRSTNDYNHWAQSLDAYEASVQVSPFSSKFDAFLAGNYKFTKDEEAGYRLFNGKANCNSCHLDGKGTLKGLQQDTSATADTRPLLTCFGSANLGLPLNPRDAFYYQTTPDPYGFTPNPIGFGYRDLGLGEFLRSGFGTWASPNVSWKQFAPTQDGRMQVSTARNVALAPPQCTGGTDAPGPYFQKEFFHNGYIKSLKQLVHFYNTRDVFPYNVTSGHCPAGTTEKVDCWPKPEVPNNMDMTVGKLGLSEKEEDQVVAFMKTLTDGFTKPYPNSDVYAGMCMSGGSAKTQGNEFLIPTPTLPPCAPEVCGIPPVPIPPIQ
jgi:cytochrome c peroxidase